MATGIAALGIGGWAALAIAGLAGLRGGVSLLAPRRTTALVEADPAIRVDGYTASGPVSLILWLAILAVFVSGLFGWLAGRRKLTRE